MVDDNTRTKKRPFGILAVLDRQFHFLSCTRRKWLIFLTKALKLKLCQQNQNIMRL